MTAEDLVWGRRGGRTIPADVVLPGEIIRAACERGHRTEIAPASLGKPCWWKDCPGTMRRRQERSTA